MVKLTTFIIIKQKQILCVFFCKNPILEGNIWMRACFLVCNLLKKCL